MGRRRLHGVSGSESRSTSHGSGPAGTGSPTNPVALARLALMRDSTWDSRAVLYEWRFLIVGESSIAGKELLEETPLVEWAFLIVRRLPTGDFFLSSAFWSEATWGSLMRLAFGRASGMLRG